MRIILTGYRPIIFGIAILMFLIMTGCVPKTHGVYKCSFLVSWSHDGKQAAAVSNLLEETDHSGLWIFDAASGSSRQIFAPEEGSFCLHPQWSPYDDRILFGIVRNDEEDEADEQPDEDLIPYSVWVIEANGRGLTKILDGVSQGGAILTHNTVAWGPSPQTIIVQNLADDGKVTAMLYDLASGGGKEFLPRAADAYSLEISPSHEKAVAILYDLVSETAEVFLEDFGVDNWQSLGSFAYDNEQLEAYFLMIYWAPDSSGFVVPGTIAGTNPDEKDSFDLRLFDISSGCSHALAQVRPNTALIWNEAATGFYFSGASAGNDERSAIYRVDRKTGQITVLSAQNDYLLSVDRASERIYFYREERIQDKDGAEEKVLRRMFSCAANGMDRHELSPWLEGDCPMIRSASPNGQRLMFLDKDPELFNLIELEAR